jgi:O-antigen/teichoic acid export membrane protein
LIEVDQHIAFRQEGFCSVTSPFEQIERIRSNLFARNTGWMLLGLGGNALLQAITFILLARLLGVTEYGVFAGAFALVSTVAPYSSLGSHMIFMRYVSADRASAPVYWGNMVAISAATTVLLAIGLALACQLLFGSSAIELVVVLVIANCFAGQITNNASVVFQTFGQLRSTAWLRALTSIFRIIAIAGLMACVHHATALQCSVVMLGSSVLAGLLAVIWIRSTIGAMLFSWPLVLRRFWEGIGFSVAGSTQSVYNDLDKMMLSHYGMNAANGIYTFAYRVVDFATIPVNSIDGACLPRYFSLNNDGLMAVARMARKIVPIGALVGLACAVTTLLASPLAVRVVGHGFAGALPIFRWLCWLPAIRAVHQLMGGVLTATGLQNFRTAAQVVIAIFNLCLNVMWIPVRGWLGAAWASLASDGALAVLNTLLVLGVVVRARHGAHLMLQEEPVK